MRKVYDTPKTPYQRLLDIYLLSHDRRASLQQLYRSLNPVSLRRQLDKALEALWDTAELHPFGNNSF